jgi:hypothetical protein
MEQDNKISDAEYSLKPVTKEDKSNLDKTNASNAKHAQLETQL